MVEHMIDHNRPARALPAQVPRLRQGNRMRLGEQGLQGVLILGKVTDARPHTARQTMPRQVAGDHGKILIQRPLDDMSIKPGVIVETVQQKQRALDLFRPPAMADQFITVHLESTRCRARPSRSGKSVL